MPRLFTGVEIPADVAQDLAIMKGGIEGARWIDPDNYHLTLRFVGDIPDRMADELTAELQRVVAMPAFNLKLAGMGFFGTRKPHSLHVKAAESPDLRRLQAMHERVCQSVGLPPEQRKFMPHVTLARTAGSHAETGTGVCECAQSVSFAGFRCQPVCTVFGTVIARRRSLWPGRDLPS